MRVSGGSARKVWTEAELQALPDDGYNCELVDGELVKILSPSNTRVGIDGRLKDFFASGTQIAWMIDPDNECVEVCRSPTDRKLIGIGGFLDGEQLLPGFHYPIADLFKEWDWD